MQKIFEQCLALAHIFSAQILGAASKLPISQGKNCTSALDLRNRRLSVALLCRYRWLITLTGYPVSPT